MPGEPQRSAGHYDFLVALWRIVVDRVCRCHHGGRLFGAPQQVHDLCVAKLGLERHPQLSHDDDVQWRAE